MTNYRRLISYIYAYEGEVKGKNIGLCQAGIPEWAMQAQRKCKKVYVGSSDLGFICWPRKRNFLGSIYLSAAEAVSSAPW